MCYHVTYQVITDAFNGQGAFIFVAKIFWWYLTSLVCWTCVEGGKALIAHSITCGCTLIFSYEILVVDKRQWS